MATVSTRNIEWVSTYDGTPSKPAPITVYPYKNRVAVSPVYGCGLGCEYCQLLADQFPEYPSNRPTRIADVHTALLALGSIRKEIGGYRLTLSDHTDPFLAINQNDTIGLVAGLVAGGYVNPIAITSKKAPPVEVMREISHSKLRLTQFVSLGDITGQVEHVSVEERLLLAERSRSCNIHTVLLLRPLSPYWCDPEGFFPVIKRFAGLVDEVVVSGIRSPSPIQKALFEKGVMLEIASGTDQAVANIQQDFEAAMVVMVARALPGIVISRTRSCSSNRRYNLPCLPSSATIHPLPEHIRMSLSNNGPLVTKRDWNGFCRLTPPARPELGFTIPQVSALQNLSLMFDASPALSWRLIGGAARVIQHFSSSTFDIDLHIDPESFEFALERLRNSTRGIQISKCSGPCSKCSDCEIKTSECELLFQDRMSVLVSLNGVKIDLSPAKLRPGRTVKRFSVGGVAVPVETEDEEIAMSCA